MSEWITWPLRELADIRVSNVDKKSLPGEKPVLLCNYMDAYANDYIRSDMVFMEATASAIEIAKFKVDVGDVVITKDSETPDDIGIPAVVMDQVENLVCGYHLALLKTKQEFVDPVFLCKQLGSQEAARYFGHRAAGSTRYGLSNGALASIYISLPTLPEQKKIAAVLSSIDSAIEKTEALIAKYQQIKAGLMHDLFTRGVLPSGQLRPPREQAPELYKETAIGWIPKEWRINPLGECLKARPKNGYSPREVDSWQGLYVLGLGCLTPDGFEAKQLKNAPRDAAIVGGALLAEGDFLISRANTPELVGLCGTFKDIGSPAIYPDLMMRLKLVDSLDSDFLEAQLLMSATRKRLTALAVGTSSSMAKLNAKSVQQLLIALPDPVEQRAIIERVAAAKCRIDRMKSEACKLQAKKAGLMHDLLTGKVSVNAENKTPTLEAAA